MASSNAIITLLQNLPPGTNQFRAIQIFIRSTILPLNDLNSNYIIQLKIFSGLFALSVFQ